MKMVTRIWTKPATQDVIKVLRASGLTVEKLNAGYECKVNGVLVFKAMVGSNGYLARHVDDLFVLKGE